jgi:hypothetical protein
VRARLPSISFRLLVLTAVWVLGTATVTLAQDSDSPPASTEPTAPAPGTPEVGEVAAAPLIVPDVRGLPYVFAKGVLEDAGLAWEITGKVEGYAVNLVTEQNVKPGSWVEDTGMPTIQLRLQKNPTLDERGVPENASPYEGTELLLTGTPDPAPAEEPEAESPGTGTEEGAATEPETATEPAETEPATTTESSYDEGGQAAPQTVEPTPASSPAEQESTEPADERPEAFEVAGAPPEPLDEITLPERARRLEARLADEPRPTPKLVDFWQYQHAWIVTGATFGWWHGAEALRILIRVDEDLQDRWGVGAKSEAVARAALAEVLRKSR